MKGFTTVDELVNLSNVVYFSMNNNVKSVIITNDNNNIILTNLIYENEEFVVKKEMENLQDRIIEYLNINNSTLLSDTYDFFNNNIFLQVYSGNTFIIVLTYNYTFYVYGLYNNNVYRYFSKLMFDVLPDLSTHKIIQNEFKTYTIKNELLYTDNIVYYDMYLFDKNNEIYLINYDGNIYYNLDYTNVQSYDDIEQKV